MTTEQQDELKEAINRSDRKIEALTRALASVQEVPDLDGYIDNAADAILTARTQIQKGRKDLHRQLNKLKKEQPPLPEPEPEPVPGWRVVDGCDPLIADLPDTPDGAWSFSARMDGRRFVSWEVRDEGGEVIHAYDEAEPNEPVPLRVGMKVRHRGQERGPDRIVLAWATPSNGVAYVWTWTGVGHGIFAVPDVETLDGRPVCLPDDPAAPPFDLAGWIDEQHSAWALIQPCAFSDYLIEQALDLPAPAAPPLDLAAWLKAEKERWLLYGVGDTGDLFEWLVGAARGLSAPVDRQTAEAIVERCVVAARNMPNLDSIVQPSETTSAYRSGYNLAQQNACAAIRYVDLSDLPDPWEIVAKRIYGDEWHEDLAMGPSDLLPLIRPLWERAYTPEQIERALDKYFHRKHLDLILEALRDGEGE